MATDAKRTGEDPERRDPIARVVHLGDAARDRLHAADRGLSDGGLRLLVEQADASIHLRAMEHDLEISRRQDEHDLRAYRRQIEHEFQHRAQMDALEVAERRWEIAAESSLHLVRLAEAWTLVGRRAVVVAAAAVVLYWSVTASGLPNEAVELMRHIR